MELLLFVWISNFNARTDAHSHTNLLQAAIKLAALICVQYVETMMAGKGYEGVPAVVKEMLLPLVNTHTADISLRALAFAALARTTDSEVVAQLAGKLNAGRGRDVEQFEYYARSFVQSLLEDNTPSMARWVWGGEIWDQACVMGYCGLDLVIL